jgi:hypothetical protein
MVKFAFVSHDAPTADQVRLAAEKGVELVHVGDRDPFTVDPREFFPYGGRWKQRFAGVVVVHPAAALRLAPDGEMIGVFDQDALRIYRVYWSYRFGLMVEEVKFVHGSFHPVE